MVDIRGHKDKICAARKTPIWCIVSREYIKLPTLNEYQKIKNNHLETQTNARNNIRQNLSIKIATTWRIFLPPLNISGIFADFFI
jgi:hypothetical protein